MITADPSDVPYPGAIIHWLGAAGAPARHEVRHTDNTDMALSLIVGDGCDAGHVEAARRMAGARGAQSLCLAVMSCAGAERERALVDTLGACCDGVVAVAPDQDLAASAEALCSAILSPMAAGHPWCFDWNDMRELCRATSATAAARVFAGRARGEDAVRELAARWRAGRVAGPRKLLVGVGVHGAGQMVSHHALVRALVPTGPDGATAGSGIVFDSALALDEVVLTVVDFGPVSPRPAGVFADRAGMEALSGLPQFLRRE